MRCPLAILKMICFPIVLELPSGEQVHLVGRIDRVDALKADEGHIPDH